jgi:hypothetical protein
MIFKIILDFDLESRPMPSATTSAVSIAEQGVLKRKKRVVNSVNSDSFLRRLKKEDKLTNRHLLCLLFDVVNRASEVNVLLFINCNFSLSGFTLEHFYIKANHQPYTCI